MNQNRLIRTDSTMINPSNQDHNYLSPKGEVIMSPRKRNSIINSICIEVKQYVKQIPSIDTQNIHFDTYLGATKLLQNKSNLISY